MKRIPAILAASALLLVPAGAAHAAPPASEPTVIASGLVSPLHVSIGPGKSAMVSQEFAGLLTQVNPDGSTENLVSEPGWLLAGSDTRGATTYYLDSQGAGPFENPPVENIGRLLAVDPDGSVRVITDQIGAYEAANNPDQVNHYGLTAFDAECAAELRATDPFHEPQYTGVADSHPYALDVVGRTAYVADAGMNAVIAVDLITGAISTVAVLPPRPVTVSAQQAEDLGVPACAGLTYAFEPVPTDVERGRDGWLYVSSLPGGPEEPVLGVRGAIFRINPATGDVQLYADRILTPTGIAFGPRGELYVASLFGGGIYRVPAGGGPAQLFLQAALPADVTVSGSTLYATTNVLGPEGAPPAGQLISLKL